MGFTGTLIFFTLIGVYLNYLWSRRKYYYLSLKLDSVWGLPFVGIAFSLSSLAELLPFFRDLKYKLKKLNGIVWFGTVPIYYCREPKMVKKILTHPDCVQKMTYYDVFTKHYGAGIISTSPPVWNHHRKLLDPAFHTKILKAFMPIFNDEVDILLDNLSKNYRDIEFNIIPLLQLCTIRITCQTTMGIKMKIEHKEKNEKLIKSFTRIGRITIIRALNPLYLPDVIFHRTSYGKVLLESQEYLNGFVTEIIKQKIDRINNNNNGIEQSSDTEVDRINENIFIDRAIDLYTKGEFSFEDVISESNDIILGGYDTTANTTSYTIMCLAMFPEYQEKLFEELVRVFPERDNIVVNEDHLKELKYMEVILNENMRVMSPIPFIGRENTSDFPLQSEKGNNLILPKNTQILIDIFNMQRDESTWGPKAKTFYPEHFDPENIKNIHPFAFIPFTKGVRTCIGSKYAGMSLKVILAKILRKYKFTTEAKFEDLEFLPNVMLKIRKPAMLRITEREY